MSAFLQMTFSDAFSWMKLLYLDSNFTANIGPDNDFMPKRRQAIIWINDGLVYWYIYVSLGLNSWHLC